MRLLRGRVAPGAIPAGSVVAIGKFDGLHRGHREVLARTCEEALARSLPAVLVTFEPLPEEFFAGDRARARLSRFTTKWRQIAAIGGIDAVACLRFDRAFSARPADEFVLETLVRGLAARAVFVGEGFRFGHKRRGDTGLLERMGRRHGFATSAVAAVSDADGRISSSRVHQALAANRLDQAGALLGRSYRLYGRVRRGDKLGAKIGFATANLSLGRHPPPLAGIYVVRAEGLPGGARHGVASVGTRPAVGGTRRLLEVHFPGFTGDLYGRLLALDFLHWLRAERGFASRNGLIAAIRADVEAGERWLKARAGGWDAG